MENGEKHIQKTSKFQTHRFYNISIQDLNKGRKKSLASFLSPRFSHDTCASYSINSGSA